MKKRIVALLFAMLIIGSSVGYASGEEESAEQLPGESAEQIPVEVVEPSEAEAEVTDVAEVAEEAPSAALIISREQQPEGEYEEPEAAEANEYEESEATEASENDDNPLSEASDSEFSEKDISDIASVPEETVPESEEGVRQGTVSPGTEAGEKDAGTDDTDTSGSATAQREITISNLEWDQTNESLLFHFTSTDDDTEYDAHLLGCKFELKEKGDGVYPGTETECYTKLAIAIADAFYNKTSFDINDTTGFCNEYGLIPYLIDAEKISLADDSTDSNLCWAASSADMLKFADWELVDKTTGATLTVDEMYDLFRTNFNNDGSCQEVGVKWVNNGVNPYQEIDSNGNVVYPGDSSKPDDSSMAQQKYDDPNWTGCYPDYAAESYTEYYDLDSMDCFPDAVKTLDDGNAVGLGIEEVNSAGVPGPGGHAITLFGYIKTIVQQGIEELKAIFFTDSDNNVEEGQDRSQIIDSVTMYTVTPATYASNYTGKTYNTYGIDGYSSRPGCTYVISDYTVLKNRAYVEQSEKIDTGSRNIQTNVDLLSYEAYTTDSGDKEISQAYVGDQVKIHTVVKNVSYCKLTDTDYANDPHLQGTLYIYKEGSQDVYAEKDIDILLEDYNWEKTPDLLPNQTVAFFYRHVFSDPGTYYYVVAIDGIVYGTDGSVMTEAYQGNNISSFYYKSRIVVTDKPVPGTDENENGDSGMEKITTFTTSYNRTSNLPHSITVRVGDFKGADLDSLALCFAGRILDKTLYTITKNADGTVSLTFTSDFLNTMDKGRNHVVVQASGGDTLFIIYINVV